MKLLDIFAIVWYLLSLSLSLWIDCSWFRSPGSGDRLLINEWEQLGGIPLTANQSVTTAFWEGLREVGRVVHVSNHFMLRFLAILVLSSQGKLWAFNNRVRWPSKVTISSDTCIRAVLNYRSVVCVLIAWYLQVSLAVYTICTMSEPFCTPSVCSLFVPLGTLDVVEKSIF